MSKRNDDFELVRGSGNAFAGRVKLERFTIDRLLSILEKLGQNVEVSVKVFLRRARPNDVSAQQTDFSSCS